MNEALVPEAAEPVVVADGEADVVLPALIVDAGPEAAERFLEFFAGRIANERTRAAYGRAVGQFLAWCEVRGLGLRSISLLHVAAYIRTHPGSVPTVKQHLAAIRMLCDWLVVSQVLPVNPAAAVRGPKHVVTKGATPVLTPTEGEEAPRAHRHGHAGRAPRPGALLGDALQLRAGERGSGDEEASSSGQSGPEATPFSSHPAAKPPFCLKPCPVSAHSAPMPSIPSRSKAPTSTHPPSRELETFSRRSARPDRSQLATFLTSNRPTTSRPSSVTPRTFAIRRSRALSGARVLRRP